MKQSQTLKMVYLAMLIAFAVGVHTIEAALPLPIPIPGVKLGLANIITIITLVFYGYRSALAVASMRSILGSLITGSFLGFGFYLSFGGAIVSALAMGLMMPLYRNKKITLLSVSIGGAAVFNIVQLALASMLMQNTLLFRGYLPVLLCLAIPTGLFTGLTAHFLEGAIRRSGLRF